MVIKHSIVVIPPKEEALLNKPGKARKSPLGGLVSRHCNMMVIQERTHSIENTTHSIENTTHCNMMVIQASPPADFPRTARHDPPVLKSALSSSAPCQPHRLLSQLTLCPLPARLHHSLHQLRRHHQVQASLLLSIE